MNTHADKSQETQSKAVANGFSEKANSSQSTFQFVDNRPETIQMRKLQEMANNSPQAQRAAQFQTMVNGNNATTSQENESLEEGATLQEKGEPGQKKENTSQHRSVIQRITHNGLAVNIGTLNLVDARNHLGRLRRIRGITGAGGVVPPADALYAYLPADEAALQQRIQTLEAAALDARRLAVVAGLVVQLAALATAADWANPPAWAGTTPTAADGGETIGANLLPATVAARWAAFLGGGTYSHKHPRTGVVDATRLVSADGQRSIRYGAHEQNSSANQHHFHEETWTYDAPTTTLTVANVLRRTPVT